MQELLLGQLCQRRDCNAEYYYMGKRKIRNGKIVFIFVKYEKTFYPGFYSFDKLSEFDERMQCLSKVTVSHFQKELENNDLYLKI